MFSVVLPCFNESRHGYLPQILENLCAQRCTKDGSKGEIEGSNKQLIAIVSPSEDDTLEVIQRFPEVEVIESAVTNRAQRLNVGIEASKGEFVLLHHPATLLPEKDALIQAQTLLEAGALWGGFVHGFDLDHWLLRFTSWYSTRVRSRQSILYLDHCIFARRKTLIEIGGVPDMDIFEDTALSVALRKKGKCVIAPGKVITSARRFQQRGIYRQALLNQLLKLMYYASLDPKQLNRLYERKSQINVGYSSEDSSKPTDKR